MAGAAPAPASSGTRHLSISISPGSASSSPICAVTASSDKATTGFTTERFAQDMFAVADDAGAGQIVVLGYSMSGRWAQWMACTQPERVVGQILIAPVPAADIPFPDEVKDQWLQVARDKNMATFDPWVHQFTKDRLRPELGPGLLRCPHHDATDQPGPDLGYVPAGRAVHRPAVGDPCGHAGHRRSCRPQCCPRTFCGRRSLIPFRGRASPRSTAATKSRWRSRRRQRR